MVFELEDEVSRPVDCWKVAVSLAGSTAEIGLGGFVSAAGTQNTMGLRRRGSFLGRSEPKRREAAVSTPESSFGYRTYVRRVRCS